MNLSDDGYTFISQNEGIRETAYQDSIGKWTIGIGFIEVDGQPVTEGMTLTDDQIKDQFLQQITAYENAVNTHVTSTITQNQFDALVDFCYNLGCGNFEASTLLKKINIDPSDATIADEFVKWDRAGGHVIQGLLNRRNAESTLYFS